MSPSRSESRGGGRGGEKIAEDRKPGGDEGGPSNIQGLAELRQTLGRNKKRLGVMLCIWLAIAAGAYLASRHWWRDDLPRSTIGAVALVLWAAAALAIFGASGPKTLVAVVVAFGAVVAIGGGTVTLDALLDDGPPQEKAIVNCPPEPTGNTGFVAPTLGSALVREEASLSSGVLLRYTPGCELRLPSYCIGDPKNHWRFNVPDPVWFRAPGDFHDGFIASADIRGAPSLERLSPAQDCPRTPPPGTPEITSPLDQRLSGEVEITAAVPHAVQVGFAVFYEDNAGKPRSATWHQIGVDVNPSDGVSAQWDTRSVPGQSTRRPASVTIAVVPCIGLEAPYYHRDHLAAEKHSYVVANRGGPRPAQLSVPVEERDDAGEKACNNAAR